jgi:hypothetical protein
MRFERKLAAALALLASTGMWRSNYAPPIYRALWRFGVRVPPPHFRRFAVNFVFTGSSFGGALGLLMFAYQGWSQGTAIRAAELGALFGFFMALYYRYGTYRHRIPLWKDFQPIDADVFS